MWTDKIITPFGTSNARLGSDEDGFHYFQSSHSMHIEQAFGTMKARWGILWKPLRYSLVNNVAMCLYNLCVDNADHSAQDLRSEEDYSTIQSYAS